MKVNRIPFAFLLLALFLGLTAFNTQDRIAAYESPARAEWQKPDEVVAALKIREGSQIADLGSGSGYFTFRLADATGPSGKVYAVDVNSEMNEYVNGRAEKGGYQNVSTVLAATDDPRLPQTGIDLIFSCDSYHHLENRTAYFKNVKQYLKPGARVAIIDFKKEAFHHYTESHIIKQEMEAAGYKLEEEIDTLPRQHFLMFSVEG